MSAVHGIMFQIRSISDLLAGRPHHAPVPLPPCLRCSDTKPTPRNTRAEAGAGRRWKPDLDPPEASGSTQCCEKLLFMSMGQRPLNSLWRELPHTHTHTSILHFLTILQQQVDLPSKEPPKEPATASHQPHIQHE